MTDVLDVRKWPVINYSLYYRTTETHIRVLRIWDNRRDPNTLTV
jgi:hypothetical protein